MKTISNFEFPPLEFANEDGLLCISNHLNADMLLMAYRNGIFPWPVGEENFIPWFSPTKRALLFLDNFHAPKSLIKEYKKQKHAFSFNTNFIHVIQKCADLRRQTHNDTGTWITEKIIEAYTALHHMGYCHSVECYLGEKLVGGLYGVAIGKMFAGESMFHLESNASKLCLLVLVEYLKQKDVSWIDCQQMTPLLKGLGAKEVARDKFINLLKKAIAEEIKLFPLC
jgi:leucyl/phenylalanyl-tRNA---protein transferase